MSKSLHSQFITEEPNSLGKEIKRSVCGRRQRRQCERACKEERGERKDNKMSRGNKREETRGGEKEHKTFGVKFLHLLT